jgi:6-phosphogluconate dehydrogenase
MPEQNVGLIGLAVMGQNLALNVESKGFSIAVYNRTEARTKAFLAEVAPGRNIVGASSIEQLVASLESPRKIILMVQAGAPVDEVIGQLRPRLAPGDVIMDGGNSFFRDTERRSRELVGTGIHFFGVGISGGEEGALKGPAIMPGGPKDAYPLIEPILTKIAAQVDDGPCCAYIGPAGAGHFVKMAHNGCEYAIMQAIAEVYDLLAHGVGVEPAELASLFAEWNETEAGSYLVEITAKVLAEIDPISGGPLIDVILDKAGQKGTGKWTSQIALDLGVPVPSIDAAMWARNASALKDLRVEVAQTLHGPTDRPTVERGAMLESCRRALYASMLVAYAQTMALIVEASREYGYGVDLAEVARIWKGGCIIRAKALDLIQESFQGAADDGSGLPNLLLDPVIANDLNRLQGGWRLAVLTARAYGLPCPALSASLDYFETFRQARLPANLIQGLRDFFGAHTYERVDRPGVFHTEWPSTDETDSAV